MSIDKLFWSKVQTGKRNECWEWQGSCFSNGYGYVRRRRYSKILIAHRYALYLCGQLENLFGKEKVLHSCDNRRCVNPFHLFLGTQQDNVNDMRDKGRGYNIPPQSGEQNPNSKLSKSDIIEIRKLSADGISYSELGRRYGVSHTNIRCIVLERTWKTILPPC